MVLDSAALMLRCPRQSELAWSSQRPNKVTPASSPEVSSGTQFLAKDLEGGISAGTIWEVVSFALRRGSHTEGTWLCEEVTPRALGKLMWKGGGTEGGEEPGGLSQTLHQPGVTSLQLS